MVNSEVLLQKACDILTEGNISKESWSIGGGTVLMHYYEHRLSKDIDIFLQDVDLLGYISPRFNNASEDSLEYTEMSQFTSLTFPEGKIDFIVSPQITSFSPKTRKFFGQSVRLDDPVEIICKKVFFRGDRVVPRDIFDFAIVANSKRKYDLISELEKIPDKTKIFQENVETLSKALYSHEYNDMLLENGIAIKGKELKICRKVLSNIRFYTNTR